MLTPNERRARIIDLFERRPYYSTLELSTLLHTSRMSVRRDLQGLAGEGVVSLVHGGAQLNVSSTIERDMLGRSQENRLEKEAIGSFAAGMIGSGEEIGVDGGSTTLEVVRHIEPGCGLTVATHSLPVMMELAGRKDITLFALGGTLHHGHLVFTGPTVIAMLATVHLSTLILGTSGIDAEGGLSCGEIADAETKRALIHAADRVIVVADHSKIGRRRLAIVASLKPGYVLVTDSGVRDADRERLSRLGVDVRVVACAAGEPSDAGPARRISS